MKESVAASKNSVLHLEYNLSRVIQNKRAKIKQDIGVLHWTIWGREPGVHEASLRRYGSKLVYHITLYFFIYISYSYLQIQYIDTINVPFCILQQLLKLTTTTLNANMTSACKVLPHSNKYPWCILNNIIGSYYSGN